MKSDSIKFRAVQNPTSKDVRLEIYRPYGINDEWMKVDALHDMTVEELKSLTQYLIYIFKKSKK